MVCVLFLISVVMMSLFLYVRNKGVGVIALFTKILASVSFIALGLSGVINKTFDYTYMCFIIGLVCGLVGDVLLDLKMMYKEEDRKYFNLGVLSFSLGHVAYFSALLSYFASWIAIAISISIGIAFAIGFNLSSKMMKLKTEDVKFQMAAYSFILAFVTSFCMIGAINNSSLWISAIGLILFFISDFILSFIYFKDGDKNKTLVFLNHLAYYLGQILIALNIFFL